tara:strand:- start:31 stop:186 length:156 start_codon:yes stop_codon:yes gene_type:complete
MKLFTKKQIIEGVRKLFPNSKFYVTKDEDLTMSFEGQFVNHQWKKGTFINK